jgi:hypothetical protein
MRLSSVLLSSMLAAATLAPAVLSAGCVVGPAYPMDNGWALLGERRVAGHGAEVHEAITGLRGDGRWTQIRFRIVDAPLEMDEIVVTFGDGERYQVPTRLVFNEGSRTRDINLPGGARVLRRVDFFMHNIPGDGHAHVELLAR